MTVSILATTDNGDPAFGLKQGTLAHERNGGRYSRFYCRSSRRSARLGFFGGVLTGNLAAIVASAGPSSEWSPTTVSRARMRTALSEAEPIEFGPRNEQRRKQLRRGD